MAAPLRSVYSVPLRADQFLRNRTVKNCAKELGIKDAVIFTGRRTDLKNVYSSFDLFLTTSLTEGLPNTILEAMAMEVPVVATRVGGVPELIEDGENGVLCNKRDAGDITQKVLSLLTDQDRQKQLSARGRMAVETKFSFDNRLRSIEGYYVGLYRSE